MNANGLTPILNVSNIEERGKSARPFAALKRACARTR